MLNTHQENERESNGKGDPMKRKEEHLWNKVFASALFGIATIAVVTQLTLPDAKASCCPIGITIGTSVSLTGKYAKSGKELLNGYTMWVEELNARGGLFGTSVKLIYEDDESDPAKSAAIYERMIKEENVDLLLGPYSSGITIAASRVAEAYNFPLLTTAAASNKIWSRGYRNVFGSISPAATWMHPVVDYAKTQGLSRIAVIYADTAFPRSIIKGAKTKAAELGMQVVFEAAYPKKNTNFAAIIEKMKGANPEVIIGGTYLPDSKAFLSQAKEQGLTPEIFAFTVGPPMPEFSKDLGRVADGVMGPSPWEPTLDFPGVKGFVERYEKKHGYEPGPHAGIGFGGGHILEAAVKKARCVEKNKIRKALSKLDTWTTLGHYKVDQTGRNIAMSTYIIQWNNGQKQIVLPSRHTDIAVAYPVKEWSAR